MRLITEEVVKKIIEAGKFVKEGKLLMPADCLLTPSAKAVVIDNKLRLVQGNETEQTSGKVFAGIPKGDSVSDLERDTSGAKGRYTLADGNPIEEKPEHLTQLSGTLLVAKDDLRIRLRGEVDLLIAELLKVQLRSAALGCQTLVDELQDVYDFIGKLSRAEVLDEAFTVEKVIGLSYADLREISHNPRRYFGREHLFTISYQDGELTILLNALRALSRRCELTFYEAFKLKDGSTSRQDLMEGYNRLSSVFYILSLRAVTNGYGER